jgi:hypothetical protein
MERKLRLLYRVVTAFEEGVAPHDTNKSQKRSFQDAILLNGVISILAASRGVAAVAIRITDLARAVIRRKVSLIPSDEIQRYLLG